MREGNHAEYVRGGAGLEAVAGEEGSLMGRVICESRKGIEVRPMGQWLATSAERGTCTCAV